MVHPYLRDSVCERVRVFHADFLLALFLSWTFNSLNINPVKEYD